MSEALRQWLAVELNRRGISQRELARQMGVSSSFVSNVISGVKPASVNFCHKVATALDVAPDTVLRLAGILPPGPPAAPDDDAIIQALVELARTLPPEDRQQLFDYAKFLQGRR